MQTITRLIRISTLQWIMGVYCIVRGAMVLIVPHQFTILFQPPLEPYTLWIGIGFVTGGVALIAAAARLLPRPLYVAAHLVAGAALLQVVLNAALGGLWSSVMSFTLLACGTAAAGLLPPQRPPGRIDAFALLMALSTALTGVTLLLPLEQLAAPVYAPVRPYLGWYGAAFIASGLLLAGALLHRRTPRPLAQAAHVLLGCTLAMWTIGLGLPSWNSLLYYIGLGVTVAALPWLGPLLARFDPTQLRARLMLILAGSVLLPQIIAVALVTGQEERGAAEQASALQQALAIAIADDMEFRIDRWRVATELLAAYPGLLELPPDRQREVLRGFAGRFPNITVFALFDARGDPIVHSGDPESPPPNNVAALLAAARSSGESVIDLRIDSATAEPELIIGAPVLDADRNVYGMASASVRPGRILAGLGRSAGEIGANVYLVDGRGQVLGHLEGTALQLELDWSDSPPVTALRGSDAPGTLRYTDSRGTQLAGYARVPELGWGVVVEQPLDVALADIRVRRERDFGILSMATIAMLIAGVSIARWLVHPLATLTTAAGRLATGDAEALLPQSPIAEIAGLAGAFGTMRARLSARTAERDTAEAKVRFLAEAGSLLATSLEFETTLRNVAELAVISLAEYAVVDILDEQSGSVRRVAASHAEPALQPLVQALVDYPPELHGGSRIAHVFRTGEPELLAAISEDTLQAIARDDTHLQLLRQLNLASLMTVPLTARGRTFGTISLARSPARPAFEPDDLELAVELARRAALAIDNARLYQAAQEAVGLRDQFLSIASHELKTPLTALLGTVQLLERRLGRSGLLGEREQRSLHTITSQVGRLNRMIATLLDVSRIETGNLTIERAPLDLGELAQRVIRELQPSLDRHTVEYTVDAGELIVEGDEMRLEQVLHNLIGNAAKYSPNGGRIIVRGTRSNGMATISVSDEGIGIPSEALPHLFQRFYRGTNVKQEGIAGMGIGLYVVNEIVRLHDGSISVESTLGQGTTFTVQLPLRVAQPVDT